MRFLNLFVWILLATTALSVDLERNVPELNRMFRSKMANLPVQNLVKVTHAQAYQDDSLTYGYWIPEIADPVIYWPENPGTPDKIEASFKLGPLLKSTNVSDVYDATDLLTGTKAAVKVLNKSNYNTYSRRQEAENELLVLESLPKDDPHMTGFRRYLQDDEHIYQIFDLFKATKVAKLVKAQSESVARPIAEKVLGALQAMHSYNFYHMDFHDGNVFIQGDIGVIVDFSTAVIGDEKHIYKTKQDRYETPERILNLPSTPSKIDVWYLGHIIYRLVYGDYAFGSELNEEYEKRVIAGTPIFPTSPSAELDDLLTQIFVRDDDRLTLAEVAAHPWFTK